ncbi:hypothetical protein HPB48_001487 [Haemaphysalis longicornis]|uniref:HSF-type DNA-binding domain-containing protein n=1 Tax=Haemaphysalis longicornis TaxID=44386 RepID=A0A9J6FEZ7_HAELO|nr:hypothetical protein HPB48_001487 [Haemaphysalis longicornis]
MSELPPLCSVPEEETLLEERFPKKLWKIVNNCSFGAIGWSDDGKKVEINYLKFEEYYFHNRLNIFKTKKIKSFVRLLNLYGFRKVRILERRPHVHVFRNEYFVRGRPDLLKSLRRKMRSKKSLEDGGPSSVARRPHLAPGKKTCKVYGKVRGDSQ